MSFRPEDIKKLRAIEDDDELLRKAAGQITPEILGSVIDNTVLKAYATRLDVLRVCEEANEIGSYVCVNGSRVKDVKDFMAQRGQSCRIRGVAAVIGFPFGAGATREKVAGALAALCDEDADEVDMVLNIGALRDSNVAVVIDDIKEVAQMVRTLSEMKGKKKILKVIQENCYLSDTEKWLAAYSIASAAMEIGVHIFAKTSTGFGVPMQNGISVGATLCNVYSMNKFAQGFRQKGALIGVKAAGGVKDAAMAVKMMLAGGCFDDDIVIKQNLPDIFRIGASAGKAIVDDFKERFCS